MTNQFFMDYIKSIKNKEGEVCVCMNYNKYILVSTLFCIIGFPVGITVHTNI